MIGLGTKKGGMMSQAGPNKKDQTRQTGPSHGKAGTGRQGRGLSGSGDGGSRRQRRRNGNGKGDRRGGGCMGGRKRRKRRNWPLTKGARKTIRIEPQAVGLHQRREKAAKGIGQHEWGRCPIFKAQEVLGKGRGGSFATLASLVKRGPLTQEELYPPKAPKRPKAKPHLAALARKHELKYLDQISQATMSCLKQKLQRLLNLKRSRLAGKGVEEEWWS